MDSPARTFLSGRGSRAAGKLKSTRNVALIDNSNLGSQHVTQNAVMVPRLLQHIQARAVNMLLVALGGLYGSGCCKIGHPVLLIVIALYKLKCCSLFQCHVGTT